MNNEKPKIFLSYAHEDIGLAKKVYKQLKKDKYNLYIRFAIKDAIKDELLKHCTSLMVIPVISPEVCHENYLSWTNLLFTRAEADIKAIPAYKRKLKDSYENTDSQDELLKHLLFIIRYIILQLYVKFKVFFILNDLQKYSDNNNYNGLIINKMQKDKVKPEKILIVTDKNFIYSSIDNQRYIFKLVDIRAKKYKKIVIKENLYENL